MSGRALLISSFFIIAALTLGLVVGEGVGEKVAVARTERIAEANAVTAAAIECDIAALNDRLTFGFEKIRRAESEILRRSADRAVLVAGTWAEKIVFECGEDVPPDIVVRLIARESSFRSGAVSNHGAVGLGQLKPTTAGRTIPELLDPIVNISAIIHHLRNLYSELRDWGLVLVAYNMGRNAAPVRYAAAILGD